MWHSRPTVRLLLASLPALVSARSAATAGTETMALRGVHVLDVSTGTVRRSQTVLVRDGLIAAVVADAEYQPSASVRMIDGRDRYLMPGLADMHVHHGADDLALFLANGITTVREMNGSAEALARRAAIRAGRLDGPTLLVSSPLIAGTRQPWRHELATDSLTATLLARQLVSMGYDFLKVYDGLTPEAYMALAAVSEESGVPLVGHIPEQVGLRYVLAHGQATIEHVEQIVHATTGHTLDTAAIAGIVRTIRASGARVTPTLAAMEILNDGGSRWFDSLFTRPEMRYAPPNEREWWNSFRRPVKDGAPAAGPGGAGRLITFQRRLIRELERAGVPLLVGTDTPNPLLVPGFSLLHELQALERAGIARSTLLRMATAGAAEALGQAQQFGQVSTGMRADLLLLTAYPLDSLGALRAIEGVMVRGKWHSRAALNQELERVGRARAGGG